MSDVQLEPDPNVVFTQLNEQQMALLHVASKKYYALNETGSRIWTLLTGGEKPAAIASSLAAEYQISMERAIRAVSVFLDTMRSERLLREVVTRAPE